MSWWKRWLSRKGGAGAETLEGVARQPDATKRPAQETVDNNDYPDYRRGRSDRPFQNSTPGGGISSRGMR